MKIKFPWAKRNHIHPDPTLLKYGVCAGCGHLILMGQVRNKIVRVLDRSKGGTIEWNEVFGESCAPEWDTKEIGMDSEIRYYKDSKKIHSPKH